MLKVAYYKAIGHKGSPPPFFTTGIGQCHSWWCLSYTRHHTNTWPALLSNSMYGHQ